MFGDQLREGFRKDELGSLVLFFFLVLFFELLKNGELHENRARLNAPKKAKPAPTGLVLPESLSGEEKLEPKRQLMPHDMMVHFEKYRPTRRAEHQSECRQPSEMIQ